MEPPAHPVTGILTTLIADRLLVEPPGDAARRTQVLRVKAYILGNLGRPELSPQRIAVAQHISVRYLHKLFASESTTLSRWILRARLERCRRDLAAGGHHPVTVAAVAQLWGFTSPAHFSRVFRDAYGESPRQWQAANAATSWLGRARRPAASGPVRSHPTVRPDSYRAGAVGAPVSVAPARPR